MDKKDIKIEKMVLSIEGEKVSLTMEQAKKLKGILDELFGKEVIKEVIHDHHYHDWWYRPYYYGTTNTPLSNQVYCSANALNITLDNQARISS